MKTIEERIVDASNLAREILADFDLSDELFTSVAEFMISRSDVLSEVGVSPSASPNQGDHSLYVHTKKTNGDIFYVGICKESRERVRPGEKYSRSDIWKRTEAKYGRNVSIAISGLSKDFICATESWLISVFGKRNDGGILCNISDGGEGTSGLVMSEESRKKMSLAKVGRTGDLCPNSFAVVCDGVRYGSMAEAARHLNVNTQTISNRVKNPNFNYYRI
jgi:hypothetical protein